VQLSGQSSGQAVSTVLLPHRKSRSFIVAIAFQFIPWDKAAAG
jgi:hypothetical protein